MEKTLLLSVVINTKNSSATLEKALGSVRSFADEIVVMDMQSTDNTLEIAKKYDCQVYSHKDVGYVEPARNAAIAKAKGEWIFILDADEEAPDKLKDLVSELSTTTTDSYFVPRSNIIFGRAVNTGWWPDYILRLFRKDHVTWSDELHAVPQV
jgi:glycosyltransferase involved in cell wall biosynthesis